MTKRKLAVGAYYCARCGSTFSAPVLAHDGYQVCGKDEQEILAKVNPQEVSWHSAGLEYHPVQLQALRIEDGYDPREGDA